jgi:hypothetical protein
MALGPAPFLTMPQEPIRILTITDSAISETPKKEMLAYTLSGGRDRSDLTISGRVTEFHVMPLNEDQADDVYLASKGGLTQFQCESNANLCAFRHGCRLVTDWEFEDGTSGEIKKADLKRYIEPEVRDEIGRQIRILSGVHPRLGK